MISHKMMKEVENMEDMEDMEEVEDTIELPKSAIVQKHR